MLSTKEIVSLNSITRPPHLFLWRASGTAAHPGVISGLVLLVSLFSWIAEMLTLLQWRKVSISVTFHCIAPRPSVPLLAQQQQQQQQRVYRKPNSCQRTKPHKSLNIRQFTATAQLKGRQGVEASSSVYTRHWHSPLSIQLLERPMYRRN